jgi:hypothetical protein
MALKKLLKSEAKLKPMNPIGFTDPGGSRPTPNRPTSVYQSKRPSFSGFQDPGISAGQFGFGSSSGGGNKKPSVAPKMSTYDAGKLAYANFLRGNQGQSGGISSIPTQSRVASYMQLDPYGPANIRQQYFDNRPIPTERLQRRGMQDQLLDQFKAQYTKPVVGSSNLLQMTPDAPMSLADYTMKLGRELGPTPSELMGDIRYAFGSMGRGLAEKGSPLIAMGKDIFGGIKNFFMPSQDRGPTAQSLGLTPGQMNLYNNLVGNGMNPAMALEQAKRYTNNFAMGGIATLH